MDAKTQTPGRRSDFNRRRAAALFAAFVAVSFGGYLIFGDPGHPSVPDDAVAVVDGVSDGVVTREEVDQWTDRALAAQQGPKPKPDSPEYKTIQLQVIDFLIQRRWSRGEAFDRGITVTAEDVKAELDTAIEQLGRKEFEKRKKDGNFDDDGVRAELRTSLIARKLEEGNADSAAVTDAEIEALYEAQKDSTYTEPASREVRVILNRDEAKAAAALEDLQADDSPQNWEKVAKQSSQDQVTKNEGGLLQQPIGEAGSAFGEAFDEAVFATSEGDFAGPVETERGFWVIQVVGITEERVLPLDDALRDSISNQAGLAKQQLVASGQQADFQSKWLNRTGCSDFVYELQNDIDSGATQPGAPPVRLPSCPQDSLDLIDEQQLVDDAEAAAAQGVDVPPAISPQVQVPAPISPGTALPELLQQQTQRGPQRPKTVGDPCQALDDQGNLLAEADPCGPDPEGGPALGGIDPSALDPSALDPSATPPPAP